MSYTVEYDYSHHGRVNFETLQEAMKKYDQLVDDPKASNAVIIVEEPRVMTPEEIANATKDRPRRSNGSPTEASPEASGHGQDQPEAAPGS